MSTTSHVLICLCVWHSPNSDFTYSTVLVCDSSYHRISKFRAYFQSHRILTFRSIRAFDLWSNRVFIVLTPAMCVPSLYITAYPRCNPLACMTSGLYWLLHVFHSVFACTISARSAPSMVVASLLVPASLRLALSIWNTEITFTGALSCALRDNDARSWVSLVSFAWYPYLIKNVIKSMRPKAFLWFCFKDTSSPKLIWSWSLNLKLKLNFNVTFSFIKVES